MLSGLLLLLLCSAASATQVGMPCSTDQDCTSGLKRCHGGTCLPLQTYDKTCQNDSECPHAGYYCPADPTGGMNIYWVQKCRTQKDDGFTCKEDRECLPGSFCNKGEVYPRCRRSSPAIGKSGISSSTTSRKSGVSSSTTSRKSGVSSSPASRKSVVSSSLMLLPPCMILTLVMAAPLLV